jgi:hypothetical protein
VVEGVVEPIAIAMTEAVSCPVIGIGGSARCDGQVLVTEDMVGMFERVPRFRETLCRCRQRDLPPPIMRQRCATAAFPASSRPISRSDRNRAVSAPHHRRLALHPALPDRRGGLWLAGRSVEGVIEVLWIVGVLAVLEISLS